VVGGRERSSLNLSGDAVVYLVSYDSERPKDFTNFTRYLQRTFPVCSQILSSQYLVRSEANSLALVVDLLKHMDSGDRLFVSEVTQNLAWHNLKVAESAMENWETEARDCD
jgi:hypothetical protein